MPLFGNVTKPNSTGTVRNKLDKYFKNMEQSAVMYYDNIERANINIDEKDPFMYVIKSDLNNTRQ